MSAIVRQELQNFISGELKKQGYSQVFTPHIGRLSLYKTSGHFPYYKDSQFPPVVERDSQRVPIRRCKRIDTDRVQRRERRGLLAARQLR